MAENDMLASASEQDEDYQSEEHAEEGADQPNLERPSKKRRDERYAIPTQEEMSHLRETEDLFKSNLLNLEVAELLKEVRVDYTKKSVKEVEAWLFKLKEALASLPSADLSGPALRLPAIELETHNPERPVTLAFQAPSSFDLVGSYLLKTVVRPSLAIDLAVGMPEDSVQPKDYLNHRYLDKRKLFLGQLAKYMGDKTGALGALVRSVEVAYFRGDSRKPVLMVRPELGQGAKGAAAKWVVRLLPCLPEGAFAAQKLGPLRNSVRRKRPRVPEGEEDRSQPPTPGYNAAVLEDACMKRHLALLHSLAQGSPAMQDAIMLGKVWLSQRGMRLAYDSLGGYELGMCLGYLLQSRQLSAKMGALQMFQALLKFLASGHFRDRCLLINSLGEAPSLSDEDQWAYGAVAAVKLIDTACGINVMARVSSSAALELEREASASLQLLQSHPPHAFASLFLSRAGFYQRFDAFLQVPVVKVDVRAAPQEGGPSEVDLDREDDGLCDMCPWQWAALTATKALTRGLGDRCLLVRPLCGADAEDAQQFQGVPGCRSWPLTSPPPSNGYPPGECLVVGLLVDPANANRVLDRGPSAEDHEAAKEFRTFWGGKSELRRFKDGGIVEAVVWGDAALRGSRQNILEQVTRFILQRHDPLRCAGAGEARVGFRGNQLLGLVAAGWGSAQDQALAGKVGLVLPEDDDQLTRTAVRAMDKLAARIKQTEGMPLRVESVTPVSPLLRYTSVFPPCPHPLAVSPKDPNGPIDPQLAPGRPMQSAKIASQVEPIEALLKLESSGKWPGELQAVRATQTAFLIRLAQCLEKQYKLTCTAGRDFLEVLSEGYCFRLRLHTNFEVQALTRLKDATRTPQDDALILLTSLGGPHHSLVHSRHLGNPVYGPTVRIAMRWAHAHMFSNHLSQEVVELLCLHLFAAPPPLTPPATTLSGLLRFLSLLCNHDWAGAPLVVDAHQELKSEAHAALLKSFETAREKGSGPPLWLVTPLDRERGWQPAWTSAGRPERVVLARICAVARASATLLLDWVRGTGAAEGAKAQDGWKHVFRPSVEEAASFNAVLHFDRSLLADPQGSLNGARAFQLHRIKGCRALTTALYKNLLPSAGSGGQGTGQSKSGTQLLPAFRPVAELVERIEARFGHLAVFFHDGLIEASLALVWRPAAFLVGPFNVMHTRHSMVVSADDSQIMNGKSLKASVQKASANKTAAAALTVPNLQQVLSEICALGEDMIQSTQLL